MVGQEAATVTDEAPRELQPASGPPQAPDVQSWIAEMNARPEGRDGHLGPGGGSPRRGGSASESDIKRALLIEFNEAHLKSDRVW
jgi:hypothetical protein